MVRFIAAKTPLVKSYRVSYESELLFRFAARQCYILMKYRIQSYGYTIEECFFYIFNNWSRGGNLLNESSVSIYLSFGIFH